MPLYDNGERRSISNSALVAKRLELQTLIAELTRHNPKDKLNKSLLNDLCGEVGKAIINHGEYNRWGQHFLQSLHSAHFKQQRNSFKDPGPLEYSLHSPMFQNCRDELDNIFNTLPPPGPSIIVHRDCGQVIKAKTSMKRYNDRNGQCFAA